MSDDAKVVLVDQIEPLILTIRGQNVLLDSDLAGVYGVPTKRLNEQVRRNRDRFPGDFMFQLATEEKAEVVRKLRPPQEAQVFPAAAPRLHRARRHHGSDGPELPAGAVEVSVFVVRAFVKLRAAGVGSQGAGGQTDQLEKKVGGHDDTIRQLVASIRQPRLRLSPRPGPAGSASRCRSRSRSDPESKKSRHP